TAQTAIESPRSESAAADSDEAHGVEAAAHPGGVVQDRTSDIRLLGEVRKPVVPGLVQGAEAGESAERDPAAVANLVGRKAVRLADHRGREVGRVELYGHQSQNTTGSDSC